MGKVIDLSGHRAPVLYTVDVTHHWNGEIEVSVGGISDDPRSRSQVAVALRAAADLAENGQALPINPPSLPE